MYGAGDVRVEDVPDAHLIEPTDALVRVTRAADLRQRPVAVQVRWSRARPAAAWATSSSASSRPSATTFARVKVGDLVVSPFLWSDGTCVFCREGLHTLLPARRQVRLRRRRRRPGRGRARPAGGRHARRAAGGRGRRADAVAAHALRRDGAPATTRRSRRGRARETVAVVGDGAVGLCGVIAAEAARRRADHPARPARRTGSRSRGSSARPTSSASAATRQSSACAS